MDWLDLSREFRLVVWAAIIIWFSGSVVRSFFVRLRRPDDPMWTLWWFAAFIFIGWSTRWLTGLASPTEGNIDLQSRLALNVLTGLLGLALIWKRQVRGGWRW